MGLVFWHPSVRLAGCESVCLRVRAGQRISPCPPVSHAQVVFWLVWCESDRSERELTGQLSDRLCTSGA